ncbi:MAG: Crp/Fnr family transcriptional regulator [Alphaproteobacteria bacterium]|nr:Crp/Fnr family transcriptional regulator [Alphaproteobacteria bacterium]
MRVPSASSDHRSNGLISAMQPADYARLKPHLQIVELRPHDVLVQAGDRIKYVYFPHTAVVSMMVTMSESGVSETAMIGREGIASFEVLLGDTRALHQTVVQVSGLASRIAVREFSDAIKESITLHQQLLCYVRALFIQVTQSVACNRLHRLDERCARWLLMAHDRARREKFALTQDSLADMLGVYRPTLTSVARTFQKAGLIHYSRGMISVLDRHGLEAAACECYPIARQAHVRTFGRLGF